MDEILFRSSQRLELLQVSLFGLNADKYNYALFLLQFQMGIVAEQSKALLQSNSQLIWDSPRVQELRELSKQFWLYILTYGRELRHICISNLDPARLYQTMLHAFGFKCKSSIRSNLFFRWISDCYDCRDEGPSGVWLYDVFYWWSGWAGNWAGNQQRENSATEVYAVSAMFSIWRT